MSIGAVVPKRWQQLTPGGTLIKLLPTVWWLTCQRHAVILPVTAYLGRATDPATSSCRVLGVLGKVRGVVRLVESVGL